MVDLVHFQQDGLHHVMPDQLKVELAQQVGDVVLAAREEVVHADDLQGGVLVGGVGMGGGVEGFGQGALCVKKCPAQVRS